MRRLGFRLSLVFTLLLTLAGATPGWGKPAAAPSGTPGVYVRFTQLNWMESAQKVGVPLSRVGSVELSFDARAAALLVAPKGAFVNILVSSNGKPASWAVRNLYLRYDVTGRMLQSSPSVQFDLGVANGTTVKDLRFAVSLSAKPRGKRFAALALRKAPVAVKNYRVGGRNGGGSEKSLLPLRIGAWGKSLNPTDNVFLPVLTADTRIYPESLPAVAEGVNGCAPGAVARSIQYMLEQEEDWGIEGGAQSIYEELVEDMQTVIGDPGGTTDDNLVAGKEAFNERHGLPIDTDVSDWGEGVEEVAGTLEDGGDVEILISWDADGDGISDGGHVAMVTSIVVLPDGTIQITYIDDPQGDADAENEEHVIWVNPDGTFVGSDGSTGWIDGFVVETFGN